MVAIKTLKDIGLEDTRRDFDREGKWHRDDDDDDDDDYVECFVIFIHFSLIINLN